MEKNTAICLFGATLAAGLIAAAIPTAVILVRGDRGKVAAFNKAVGTASRTALKMTRSETIRVKGSASQMVDSDFGSWSGSVAAAATERQVALMKLEENEKTVREFLKKYGFDEKDIVWNSISVSVTYVKNEKGVDTNRIFQFNASRSLSISSAKVGQIEKLDREFTDLTKQGLHVSNHGASYIITNLDSYKMKLLEAATKNAYERARLITESSGSGVGTLLSASQGIFQILAPGGGDISDYGTYDKSTIRKEVRAVVTLEFNLKAKR